MASSDASLSSGRRVSLAAATIASGSAAAALRSSVVPSMPSGLGSAAHPGPLQVLHQRLAGQAARLLDRVRGHELSEGAERLLGLAQRPAVCEHADRPHL